MGHLTNVWWYHSLSIIARQFCSRIIRYSILSVHWVDIIGNSNNPSIVKKIMWRIYMINYKIIPISTIGYFISVVTSCLLVIKEVSFITGFPWRKKWWILLQKGDPGKESTRHSYIIFFRRGSRSSCRSIADI